MVMYNEDAQAIIRAIESRSGREPWASAKSIFEHAIAIRIAEGPLLDDTVELFWNEARKAAKKASELTQDLYQKKGYYW